MIPPILIDLSATTSVLPAKTALILSEFFISLCCRSSLHKAHGRLRFFSAFPLRYSQNLEGFQEAERVASLPTLPGSDPGGTFLLHYPWSHLHRTLSGILPCEARTFLTCCLSAITAAIICLTCIFFKSVYYYNTILLK